MAEYRNVSAATTTALADSNKHDVTVTSEPTHTTVYVRHTPNNDGIDNHTYSNNMWSKLTPYSSYIAEFFGTMVLVVLGCGANAQATLNVSNAPSAYLSSSIGWGLGLMMAIYVSGGVSGGHVNPSVTLSMVLFRRFPLRKLPGYFIAQFLGAFIGAAIVYGNYKPAIDFFDDNTHHVTGPKGTASIFGTFPQPFMTSGSGFLTEIFGTAVLLIGIMAVTDEHNLAHKPLAPLAIGLTLTSLALSIGWPTGFAVNPFRDFGPRCFSAIPYGVNVFRAYNYYFWAPLTGPFVGAVIGSAMYQFMVGYIPRPPAIMPDHKPNT
ncbi:glycerol channel [Entomortierella lignicola]|nr:glycerol channel [Entomortierella lignicola]